MSTTTKRVAILVEQQYQVLEAWYPFLRLREAGVDVVIAAPKAKETYRSKTGYPITSTISAEELSADAYDGVIIPGGWAPDYLRRTKGIVDFVAAAVESGAIVGAICHGGWLLCSAKVLAGRRVTSFHAIADDMSHAGAEWEDSAVVADGNLVTSRTPDDLPAFMKTFIEKLCLDD